MADLRFLTWDRPLLPSVSEVLLEEYESGGVIDLQDLVLVLPGGRAGRRLMELLVLGAEKAGLPLLPPGRILTVGGLPEELYRPPLPLATGSEARRCWAKALEEAGEDVVSEVFGTEIPLGSRTGLLAYARILDALNRSVGAAGVTFHEVAEECRRGFLFSDEDRWQALGRIQDHALRIMRSAGRMDREEARRLALRDEVVRTESWLVLVGVAEGPLVSRRMLARVQDRVQAFIHAPGAAQEGFDGLGFLMKDWWQGWDVPIGDEHIFPVDGPGDQAVEVIRFLAGLEEERSPEEVTVGVPDPGLVPYLAQRFEAHGQATRYAEGTPLQATPPVRLLQGVADFLETGSFRDLASLLRHPDLPSSLWPETAAALADEYFRWHLPQRIAHDAPVLSRGSVGEGMRRVVEILHGPELLGALTGERLLSEWMPELLGVLARLCRDVPSASSDPVQRLVREAAAGIRDSAEELASLPAALDDPCTAQEALRILLGELRDRTIPPEAGEEAVELVGWLELHLDDAPVLALAGVNDPFLPEAVNADPFLPNALRSRLGLPDNKGRYARDAYWLTAILESTRELRVITGRRTAAGDPLRPSRLLLTGPPENVARRVLLLTEGRKGVGGGPTPGLPGLTPAEKGGFRLPPEPELPFAGPPEPLPVTAFAALIADPYTWALEQVLRLEDPRDDAQELDPRGFGILAHEVLERFARTPEAQSDDPEVIYARLKELLEDAERTKFGTAPLPAVLLQTSQLGTRLEAFAAWQAGRVAQGWRIHAVEAVTPEGGIPFEVDGRPFHLSGRIDRIDRNEATGGWILIDYKTGDGGGDPRKARSGGGEWRDLQLPLYRHLVMGGLERRGDPPLAPPPADTPLGLAYLPLSREAGPLELAVAPWSETELAEADEKAREVIRWLRETRSIPFDPARSPRWSDEGMASLLGTGVLEGEGEGE